MNVLLLRALTLALALAPAAGFAQEEPPEEVIPAATPMPPSSKGWGVELALVNQGIFDKGMHLFSRSSYLSGGEVRLTRELGASGSLLKVMPEVAYSLSRAQVGLAGAGRGDLIMQRASAGVRVSVTAPGRWGFGAYTRVGGAGLHANAMVHDPYRDHRDEAFTAGGYAGAGVELDAGRQRRRLMFAAEAGHLATPGFAFPRMGQLDVNAIYYSGSATFRW